MPALANPRHERFVQLLHRYGNQRRAYIEAGYHATTRDNGHSVAADACASRLLRHAKVAQRLSELTAMAAKRHEITVDTLLADLEADRRLAHASAQSGAAVGATMAKARLLGLIVDRKESGAPGDFANLQSVQDVIAMVRKEIGEHAAQALAGLLEREPAVIEAEALPDPTAQGSGSLN